MYGAELGYDPLSDGSFSENVECALRLLHHFFDMI